MDVWNFSAGPGMLPPSVKHELAAALGAWHPSGVSLLELSHRDPHVIAFVDEAAARLKQLLGMAADEWEVLFLPGGASGQFAAVALNLLAPGERAGYLDTGMWGRKALQEAERLTGRIDVPASGRDADGSYRRLPAFGSFLVDPAWRYLHVCTNETVDGLAYPDEELQRFDPGVPLVLDCSTDILTRQLPLERAAVVYAGAQKNLGTAGVGIVCLRRELLDRPHHRCPAVLDWSAQASARSMVNTPPVFPVYAVARVLAWAEAQGGIPTFAAAARAKAALLYDVIDRQPLFVNERAQRSLTNVVFQLARPELEPRFFAEAAAVGLVALEGHRAVGGVRASVYLAMPHEGVQALAAFMDDFAARHGAAAVDILPAGEATHAREALRGDPVSRLAYLTGEDPDDLR